MASEESTNNQAANNLSIKEEKQSLNNEQLPQTNIENTVKEENHEPIYIKVAEDENDEAVELPCEEDNSILLTTVTSQFPGASGLKYRNPESNAMRGLRLSDGKFLAPEKGWTAFSPYFCVFPRDFKRKLDEDNEKNKKTANSKNKCSDLIVLGLPWKITEDELKDYFEQFGETVMVQIKKDPKSGQSKGFGFVKFLDYDTQMRVVSKRHNIFGRWCDVRIPLSKGEQEFSYQSSEFNRKIFVGRITEDFTCDDLRNYFKKFGEISDVFIPKPFRAFAFITFKDSETAQTLCGEDHLIKNVSVHVSNAVPKVDFNASGYHNNNHHHNYGSNHHFGNHQSNYHHNSMRFNPYKQNNNQHNNNDLGRRNHHQRNNQFNNQTPSNLHANQLVNSTYNPHQLNNQLGHVGNPMDAPPNSAPPPIWANLGTHVTGHVTGNRNDLPPLPITNQYGMNPLAQKHYGQH